MLARVVTDTSAAGPGTSAAPAEPVPGLAAPAAAAADPLSRRRPRPRLTHVDAMRPVKQFGVVSTHSLQSFAPAATLGVGASLKLTHLTRISLFAEPALFSRFGIPPSISAGHRLRAGS